jgi:hypothetical protein
MKTFKELITELYRATLDSHIRKRMDQSHAEPDPEKAKELRKKASKSITRISYGQFSRTPAEKKTDDIMSGAGASYGVPNRYHGD